VGVGKDLHQQICKIAPVLLLENPKTSQIVRRELGAGLTCRLQLIAKPAKRKLRQVLTIQFERQYRLAERLHPLRPLISDGAGPGLFDLLTKPPAEGTKRPDDLRLPGHHLRFRARERRLVKRNPAIGKPKRPEKEVDVEIPPILERDTGSLDARTLVEID
jgi:hypothetical protein